MTTETLQRTSPATQEESLADTDNMAVFPTAPGGTFGYDRVKLARLSPEDRQVFAGHVGHVIRHGIMPEAGQETFAAVDGRIHEPTLSVMRDEREKHLTD